MAGTLKVALVTGNPVTDIEFTNNLKPLVKNYKIEFIDEGLADLIITSPELLYLYAGTDILLLSDDFNLFNENDNVVEIAPIPLSDNDYQRLSWKLINVFDNTTYEN